MRRTKGLLGENYALYEITRSLVRKHRLNTKCTVDLASVDLEDFTIERYMRARARVVCIRERERGRGKRDKSGRITFGLSIVHFDICDIRARRFV